MAHKKQLTTHRNYNDTVFRMLFSDRKNLLSLYNAVSGAHYDDPEKLEIVTLENAIYMGMKNDLAFIIDTDLFLYEHQSTYNPNMPLRDLFYISSEYQKLVDKKSLYSSVLQKIPAPQFIVFYNGTENKKDSWVNHLSEAFENLSGAPKLELEVLTININEGHNSELMEQCQTLREYAQYVACVRRYAKEFELNEAVKLAVDECIRNNILSEFLRANKSEVIAMSIFEYDKEEEERKLRKAEYEAGVAAGMKDGIKAGVADGISKGKILAKKDAVSSLITLGLTVEQISSALKVDVETVSEHEHVSRLKVWSDAFFIYSLLLFIRCKDHDDVCSGSSFSSSSNLKACFFSNLP